MPSIVHSNLRQLTTQNKNWNEHLGKANISDYFGESSSYDFSVDEKTILGINALQQGNYALFQEAINQGAIFETPQRDTTLDMFLIQEFEETCFQHKEQVEAYLNAGGPIFHNYLEFRTFEKGTFSHQHENLTQNNILSMICNGSSILQYVDKNLLTDAYCKECFDQHGNPFHEKINTAHLYLFRHLFSFYDDIIPIEPTSLAKMQEAGPLPNGLLYRFLTFLGHTQKIREKQGLIHYTTYINDCLKVFGQDQHDTLHYSSYREQKEKMPAMELCIDSDLFSLKKTKFTLEEEAFLFTLLAERFLDPKDNPLSKEIEPLFDFPAWINSNRESDLFSKNSSEQAIFNALLFHYFHKNPDSPILQHVKKWQNDPGVFMTDLIYPFVIKRGTVFEIIAEPLPNGTYSTRNLIQQPWANVTFLHSLAQYGTSNIKELDDYQSSSDSDRNETMEYIHQSFLDFIHSQSPKDYEKKKDHIEYQISQLKKQAKQDVKYGPVYKWKSKLFFLTIAYHKYELFKQFESLPNSTLNQVWARLSPVNQMEPFAQNLHQRILEQSLIPTNPIVPKQRLNRF